MAVAAATVPVPEHEARDAEGVEPLGDLGPLVVGGQAAVAAAGADHDRRANRIFRISQERRYRGPIGRLIARAPEHRWAKATPA